MSSVPTWQSLLYPPLYSALITTSITWLFNWRCQNIPTLQKLAAFAHLYSTASVKSVVHWFQIMRNAKFQMYDDDVQRLTLTSSGASAAARRPSGVTAYAPLRFPTRNIASPIVLLYGDSDSLVDIDAMLRELPRKRVRVRRLHGYEHLDVIWGRDVHRDVIPHVVSALREFCVAPDRLERAVKMTNGFEADLDDTMTTTTTNTPAEPLSGVEN